MMLPMTSGATANTIIIVAIIIIYHANPLPCRLLAGFPSCARLYASKGTKYKSIGSRLKGTPSGARGLCRGAEQERAPRSLWLTLLLYRSAHSTDQSAANQKCLFIYSFAFALSSI